MSMRTRSDRDERAVAAEWETGADEPTGPGVPRPLAPKTVVWASLVILLAVNALFLLANVAHAMGDGTEDGLLGIFAPVAWEGDYDGSHIEVWGHIQLFAAAAILAVLARSYRSFLLGAWGFALFVVVVDDLFQIHEDVGEVFAEMFGFNAAFGLRPEDFGELLTWAVLGVLVLVPLVIGYVKAGAWERRQSWIFVAILILLAVFAIGLDMLAIMLQGHVPGPVLRAVALAETAGEIIPMSLFLAFTIKLALAPGRLHTAR